MKIAAAVLLASALYTVDASALEKWGPTWSEVTGARYSRVTMNRSPAIIKSIDGRNYTTRVIKIEPGKRTVVVQAPPRQDSRHRQEFAAGHRALQALLHQRAVRQQRRAAVEARDRVRRTYRGLQDHEADAGIDAGAGVAIRVMRL
jgi:hypothetical protein